MVKRLEALQIGGLGLNHRKTSITQHKFKIKRNFTEVRNAIINFYRAEVEANGKELRTNEGLTTPVDEIAMWLSTRTELELKSGKIEHHLWLATSDERKQHQDRIINVRDEDKIWMMIMGSYGTGKTTILKTIANVIEHIQSMNDGKFANVAPFSYRYITANSLAEMYENDRTTFNGVRNIKLLLIDDVGREPAEIMVYGKILKPFEELMQYRYNECLGTIFTSNLNKELIPDTYGARLGSRMEECCKYVPFNAGSFRKPTFEQRTMAFENENL